MYLDKRAIKPAVATAQATNPMDKFFNPKSVAVIGASARPESVGYRILQNVINAGFTGSIYPVNHKRGEILGVQTYANLEEIPSELDDVALVVIATPASTVPDVMMQCVGAYVHNVIIITAGFGELGAEGKALQNKVMAIAQDYNIRIIGPNCLGVIRPSANLNATFGDSGIKDGSIALLSQSGAVCTAVLDYAKTEDIGFSTVVSLGAAADTDFGELLSYHATDTKTKSVILYIEAIKSGARFIQGLQACSEQNKPVILVKSGRTSVGASAASSHTGALISDDKVFDAAIDNIPGVTRIHSISELFTATKVLSKNYVVRGNRLAILTNAGGPGVMSTDYCADKGVELAELGADTLTALSAFLPDAWSHANPVDLLGDATSERYKKALEQISYDYNVDAILVLLTPQSMTDTDNIAEGIARIAWYSDIPVFASFIGGGKVQDAKDLFFSSKVCHFDTPEQAIDAFSYLPKQAAIQDTSRAIVPSLLYDAHAQWLINCATDENRKTLTTDESKDILYVHNIPVSKTTVVRNYTEAYNAAKATGYPLVLKVNMPEFSHKSDIGGVILNINSAVEAAQRYIDLDEAVHALQPEIITVVCTVEKMIKSANGREINVGMIRDPVFGPVISVGLGGTLVELLKDSALCLAEGITVAKVEKMLAKTAAGKYLKAFRNMPAADTNALIDVIMHLAELSLDFSEIQEIDINPLIVSEHGVIALDARILL